MVQIEQHVWGMTPEGEAIVLYTLRNDQGAEVRLSNYGAAIVSVTILLGIDGDGSGLGQGIVSSNLLNAAAITGRTGVSDNNPVVRSLLCAHSSQSDLNHESFTSINNL